MGSRKRCENVTAMPSRMVVAALLTLAMYWPMFKCRAPCVDRRESSNRSVFARVLPGCSASGGGALLLAPTSDAVEACLSRRGREFGEAIGLAGGRGARGEAAHLLRAVVVGGACGRLVLAERVDAAGAVRGGRAR